MQDKKSRILYVLKYLKQMSDENDPVTSNDISDYLNSLGMGVHRATIPEDIKLLQEFGIDIIKIRSSPNKYFIGSREFELPELKLLVDAVQSSRFITPKKSKNLHGKIVSLTNDKQAKSLKRELYAEHHIKPFNEQIYYTVDIIHAAINDKQTIEFRYFDYTPEKQKVFKYNGYKYNFSPYTLFWSGDYYYVIGYSNKHEKIAQFRVDRIEHPKTSDKAFKPKPSDYFPSDYANEVFSMYDGESLTVELECENALMNVIIDRFGKDVQTSIIDEKHFKVTAEVSVSPTFYGWVFQFAGKLRILSPDKVKRKYKRMASKI